MTIGEQVVDEDKQRAWIAFLARRYSQFKEPLRPFVARVIFARSQHSQVFAKELLKQSAKSSQEAWQDVFVFGVSAMGAQQEFRVRLTELSQKAESPIIRQKAKLLLN
ncbi:MAG: hypothetical protein HC902_08195 [Calothrix sp. SM1_5_4]|nr:hypothetical protein [Calothrix sp. SM1_5_4]